MNEKVKQEVIDNLRLIKNLEEEKLLKPDDAREWRSDLKTVYIEKLREGLDESLVNPEAIPTKSKYSDINIPDIPQSVINLSKVFHDIKIGSDLVQKVQNYNVDEECFIKLAELAKNLSQEMNENKPIMTSIILITDSQENNYCLEHQNNIIETISSEFLDSDIKIIIEQALRVNGEDKAFVVLLTTEQQKLYKAFIQNLNFINSEALKCIDSYGNYRWRRIKYMIRDSGCAFIMPGKSNVKLLGKGEQIAEFYKSKWKLTNFNEYKDKLVKLSQELFLDKNVLNDVFHKCILASELRQGMTLIFQNKENVLDKCHGGYQQELSDLKQNKIMDFEHQDYLERVKGDNAVVLSKEGYTLAIRVAFAPQSSTNVNKIPGTGSRHLTAQKMTQEADTIAFVVSEDGPITVFHKGESVFRVL